MSNGTDEPSAKIGLSEIYKVTVATQQDVAALRSDVRQALDGHKDHEDRLRGLEKKVWGIGGLATFLGAGISEVLRLIGKG